MSEIPLEEVAPEIAVDQPADGRGGRRSVPAQLLRNPLAVSAWPGCC